MVRRPLGTLLLVASCYASHSPGDDEPEPAPEETECLFVVDHCGNEFSRSRAELEADPTWTQVDGVWTEVPPDAGCWACRTSHGCGQENAVFSNGECRFDTQACLPYRQIDPILAPADVLRPGAAELVTVEGEVVVVERGEATPYLALDGVLGLAGAPCGESSAFGCTWSAECADTVECAAPPSCGPLAPGERFRVTGWVRAEPCFGYMQCTMDGPYPPPAPSLSVVSWERVPHFR